MGRNKTNIKRLAIRVVEELNYNTNSIVFFIGKERIMYLLTFTGGAMFGGIVTLFLHCCLILGKESDKKWEEEQITKKEEKQEK